jgi:hypothetical protein
MRLEMGGKRGTWEQAGTRFIFAQRRAASETSFRKTKSSRLFAFARTNRARCFLSRAHSVRLYRVFVYVFQSQETRIGFYREVPGAIMKPGCDGAERKMLPVIRSSIIGPLHARPLISPRQPPPPPPPAACIV